MNFVRELMIYAANFRRIHQDATIGAAILMLEDGQGGPIADGGGLQW